MSLSITTPAVLFPAESLLLLAFTNRFLALAALVRKLHSDHLAGRDPMAIEQIENLRTRLDLIRWMQALGVLSLIGCTLSMVALYFEWSAVADVLFVASVLIMAASLAVSLKEIVLSGGALAILLRDLEQQRSAENSGAPNVQ